MCLGRIYGARAVRHNSTSSKRYMDGVKPILEQSCMVSDDDTLFYVTCSCHKLIKKRKKNTQVHWWCIWVVVHQTHKLQSSNISNKLEQGKELKAALQSRRDLIVIYKMKD